MSEWRLGSRVDGEVRKRGKGWSRDGRRTSHGFALDFAHTFIFRDEVVEFLLWVCDATDAVLFCDKIAGVGNVLARNKELGGFFLLLLWGSWGES